MRDPNKIYVDVPFSKEFLDAIMAYGGKHKHTRVQQILFVMEQFFAMQQEDGRDVLITSVGVRGKERENEQRKAS